MDKIRESSKKSGLTLEYNIGAINIFNNDIKVKECVSISIQTDAITEVVLKQDAGISAIK